MEDIWVLSAIGGDAEVEAPSLTSVGGCSMLVFSRVQSVQGFSSSYFLLSSPSPFQIPEFALDVSGEGSKGFLSHWK